MSLWLWPQVQALLQRSLSSFRGLRVMPAKTERYRFVRWEIEDVNGLARMLPGGIAEVTVIIGMLAIAAYDFITLSLQRWGVW